MSDTIHAQFAKAQFEFDAPKKDKQNPHLKNMYADLRSCIEAVKGPLKDNGLFLHQKVSNEGTSVIVQTLVVNETGCSIDFGHVSVPVSKNDAQGYGSALTYARRYGVLSIGLAPEDDDGNAAVAPPPAKVNPGSAPAPAPQESLASALGRLCAVADKHGIGYDGPLSKCKGSVKGAWLNELRTHFGHEFELNANGVPLDLLANPTKVVDALIAELNKHGNDVVTLKALPGYEGVKSED